MKLKLIREFRQFDLAGLGPASIIDYGLAATHRPFLYSSALDELIYGHDGEYHATIYENMDFETGKEWRGVYQHKNPGLIGRIGWDMQSVQPNPGTAAVVAITGSEWREPAQWPNQGKPTNPAMVKRVAQILLQDRVVEPTDYLTYADQVSTIGEIAGVGSVQSATPEQEENARLQIMLHIGADFDGRRLTQGEKRAIRKKLGLMAPADPRTAWTREAQKAGIIKPGQRLWAMQSEEYEQPS